MKTVILFSLAYCFLPGSFKLVVVSFVHSFCTNVIQVNLDMTDSMGPGKLVRHMQIPSYTYDEYLICIGLVPSISPVICKNLSYSSPSYPSSPVLEPFYWRCRGAVFDIRFSMHKLI